MSIKNLKEERGFTHILVIVLAVIVIGAIGAVGYRLTMNKKTPSTTGNSNTSTSSNSTTSSSSNGAGSSCVATYHDANICHFSSFSSDFSKTAYTANLTEVQSGTTSTMTLESDGKGNTSLTGSSNGSVFNSIQLNGATYVKASGTWLEYPAGSASAAAAPTNPASSMNLGLGSGVTFKNLGTAACGSLTCFKYQIIDSSTPTSTQYVWFDNSSYKLREWQSTDSNSGTVTMNVNYQPVTITAPSPVQVINT